ncbi:hypothetical protein SLS57_000275 [Botryosphaeria dothidea]
MRDTTPHADPLLLTGATIDALGVPPLIVEGEDAQPFPRLHPLMGRLHPRDAERFALLDLKREINAKKERDGPDWTEKVRVWGGGYEAHVAVLREMREEDEERTKKKEKEEE